MTAASEAKRSEMKRSGTELVPEAAAPAAAGGRCKRAGCAAPLPPQGSGRARQFCSDECRRRHYNALRGPAAAVCSAPLSVATATG